MSLFFIICLKKVGKNFSAVRSLENVTGELHQWWIFFFLNNEFKYSNAWMNNKSTQTNNLSTYVFICIERLIVKLLERYTHFIIFWKHSFNSTFLSLVSPYLVEISLALAKALYKFLSDAIYSAWNFEFLSRNSSLRLAGWFWSFRHILHWFRPCQ